MTWKKAVRRFLNLRHEDRFGHGRWDCRREAGWAPGKLDIVVTVVGQVRVCGLEASKVLMKLWFNLGFNGRNCRSGEEEGNTRPSKMGIAQNYFDTIPTTQQYPKASSSIPHHGISSEQTLVSKFYHLMTYNQLGYQKRQCAAPRLCCLLVYKPHELVLLTSAIHSSCRLAMTCTLKPPFADHVLNGFPHGFSTSL